MDDIKLKVEYISIDKLKPYERNAKLHPQKQIEQIARSIKEYGMNDPIGVWKDNVIVEGHGRLEACKKLGIDTVPIVRLDHLTDEQRREYTLIHNKTTMNSDFDTEMLDFELKELSEFNAEEYDFVISEDVEFERRKKEFEQRMAAGEIAEEDEEYQEFLKKFELKKTTDDCYTPEIVYNAVADYVAKKYDLQKAFFVRPFYPGGNYQGEKYKKNDIVVDNPPFSILSEIIKFYTEKQIRYFLFAPALTVFSSSSSSSCCICVGADVTYENGAIVHTSFVTNLEASRFASDPELYQIIKKANDENLKDSRRELPKYSYPNELITAATLDKFSHYGVIFKASRDETFHVRGLDAQKDTGKAIFGSGFLLSEPKAAEKAAAEKAAAEKAAAEKAAATRWQLSEREKEVIKNLGTGVGRIDEKSR